MDRELVQIVDQALAEAVRRGGDWIACKPGCCDCCRGDFPITQLDAQRLREGLAELARTDPARASRVRHRVRYAPPDPGDDDFCPVLDPASGTCDLYAARPLTCRAFGPALRWNSDAVGVCELCFVGATDEEIAACSVTLDDGGREADLLGQLGTPRHTSVACALTGA